MRIAIGSDHAGYRLKEHVRRYIEQQGHQVDDFGAYDDQSVDYPDIARPVAESVAGGKHDLGILICSNGVGVSIAANKVRGIRAALCHDTFSSRRARQHTDANVLCLGAWSVGQGLAEDIVQAFLDAEFEGGRHARRVAKIREIEDANCAEGVPPHG